ncbi:MAG: restriction endonuclease subunit S [Bacteroidetes bacterium]|jgi:type I restriction enzyme S subunit|nr:MAG: restriction endonuclease subunit S [Bacteroidota bacterium]
MKGNLTRIKYVARFSYGDSLPTEEILDGDIKVFGSNGPYALINYSNTGAPAIIVGRKGSYGKINWSPEPCFASDTTFFIDQQTTKHTLRWLYYALQTLKLDEGSSEAAVPGLNRETAYNQRILVFNHEYEARIASYLDSELSSIDSLIKSKENLLTILSEKRQSLITQAVTKGLNPEVKMTSSGIEWLGEVPEHWKIEKIKYVTSKIGSGVTPKGGAEVYQQVGIPLLRSQNIHFDGLKLDDVAYISNEIHNSMSNSKVENGDVLLNITGASIGRCYYFEGQFEEANVNQHVCILRPNKKVITKYLYLLLASDFGQSQIAISQVGGGREGLNFENLKSFIMPLPSYEEQKEIVASVEISNIKLSELQKHTDHSINLLKERRSALITAAVTGQIEIPTD